MIDRTHSGPECACYHEWSNLGKGRQQKSACWERVQGPGRSWCSHGWVARNASRSRHPAIDNPAVGCMQQIAAQQQHKEMRVQVRWEAEGQHSMGLGKGSRASPSTSDARAASESEAAPHQHSPKSKGRWTGTAAQAKKLEPCRHASHWQPAQRGR